MAQGSLDVLQSMGLQRSRQNWATELEQQCTVFPLLLILLNFGISCPFDYNHSNEGDSLLSLWIAFLKVSDIEHIFMYLLSICMSTLENVYPDLPLILNLIVRIFIFIFLLLSCMSFNIYFGMIPLFRLWLQIILFHFLLH